MHDRAFRIIQETIQLLRLDLSGLTVLTEVGSSHFVFTPIIAVMSGAKKVYAWSNDNNYGKAADNAALCLSILKAWGYSESVIEFSLNEVNTRHLQEADIITNSFQLRPLDAAKLQHTKPGVVIPIMYEKWELRPSDIEVAYCAERQIKVGGTWENHPSLSVFDFCEQLMLKLIFDAGFEISENKVYIWGDESYGKLLEAGLHKNNGKVLANANDVDLLYQLAPQLDYIYFCNYTDTRELIGENGIIDLEKLKQLNPGIGIIHLCGKIDASYTNKTGISLYPATSGTDHRMTFTLSYLGLIPLLRLQASGLKVGEEMFKQEMTTLTQLI